MRTLINQAGLGPISRSTFRSAKKDGDALSACASKPGFEFDSSMIGTLFINTMMDGLLRPLPYLMDSDARHRNKAAVSQFARRERCNSSLLIGSDLVRECTSINMKDGNPLCLVDGVRAVVSDRFYNEPAEFLRIRLALE